MQLQLKRSQRTGGLGGGKIYFALDARLQLSPEEKALVNKYKLAKQSLYDSETRKKHLAMGEAHINDFTDRNAGVGSSMVSYGKAWASALMANLSLKVTIESLTEGQHIECKDLDELLGAEEAIHTSCRNIKGYLGVAECFDGREEIINF